MELSKFQKNIIKGLVFVTICGEAFSMPKYVNSLDNKVYKDLEIGNKDFYIIENSLFNITSLDNKTGKFISPILPVEYFPNKVLDRVSLKNSKVVQRRFYGKDGKALLDIDYTSHGTSFERCHKHIWKNGKRGVATKLSKEEAIKYIDGLDKKLNLNCNYNEQILNIDFDEFKELLKTNHEITFELYGGKYHIAYVKNDSKQNKYILTSINKNLFGSTFTQKFYCSKHGILEEKFSGKTLDKIWGDVIIKEIY